MEIKKNKTNNFMNQNKNNNTNNILHYYPVTKQKMTSLLTTKRDIIALANEYNINLKSTRKSDMKDEILCKLYPTHSIKAKTKTVCVQIRKVLNNENSRGQQRYIDEDGFYYDEEGKLLNSNQQITLLKKEIELLKHKICKR